MESKPETTFFTFIFVQCWLAPVVDLIPKGSPEPAQPRGFGRAVYSGRKWFPEIPPAFRSGCLGRPFPSPQTGASGWPNSLLFPQKQCLHLSGRKCGQVRTAPFQDENFGSISNLLWELMKSEIWPFTGNFLGFQISFGSELWYRRKLYRLKPLPSVSAFKVLEIIKFLKLEET